MNDATPEDYGFYPPPHIMAERIEELFAENNWLLDRVIIGRHGVALPTGNYGDIDQAESRRWLKKHLKNLEGGE